MSDLRSARKIWTALILRKINLRAAKSWFDSPSSRCWSSLTVPSCQTRETEIETHSVFFDWFENGRKFCKQDCAGLITMLSIFSWKRFRACKPPSQRNRFTKKSSSVAVAVASPCFPDNIILISEASNKNLHFLILIRTLCGSSLTPPSQSTRLIDLKLSPEFKAALLRE